MSAAEATPEQKKLYNLYAIFGVALVTSILPFASAAIISLIFFVWILIAAYVARSKAEEHSLLHNHAIYIVRTLWIAALIATLSMIAASVYMLGSIDYTPFQSCANTLAGRGADTLQNMAMSEIYPLIEPCVTPFIEFNMKALLMAAVIGLAPPLIYISYRFGKGTFRALKGYRLADPRAWF